MERQSNTHLGPQDYKNPTDQGMPSCSQEGKGSARVEIVQRCQEKRKGFSYM